MAYEIWIRLQQQTLSFTADREVQLGRDPAADVHIDNPLVSRHHAQLRPQAQGWVLEDLGSKRGTFVNGQRVTRAVVSGQMEVWLGEPGSGENLQLLAGEQRPEDNPGPTTTTRSSLSRPVRLVVAAGIVVAAAFITTQLLEAMNSPDLLEKLGLSWFGAITKVDEFLQRQTSSGKTAPTAVAGTASGAGLLPRSQLLLYGAFLFAGGMELGGAIIGVVFGLLNPNADFSSLAVPLVVGGLVAGAFLLYWIGAWIGRRAQSSPVVTLFGVAVLGRIVIATADYLFLSSEQYMQLLGQPKSVGFLLVSMLFGSLFSCILAAVFGVFGVRRGQRTSKRGA